jgi:hypothetical protein
VGRQLRAMRRHSPTCGHTSLHTPRLTPNSLSHTHIQLSLSLSLTHTHSSHHSSLSVSLPSLSVSLSLSLPSLSVSLFLSHSLSLSGAAAEAARARRSAWDEKRSTRAAAAGKENASSLETLYANFKMELADVADMGTELSVLLAAIQVPARPFPTTRVLVYWRPISASWCCRKGMKPVTGHTSSTPFTSQPPPSCLRVARQKPTQAP